MDPRRTLPGACALGAWLLAAPAAATETYAATALELAAPAECIERRALIDRVERQLERPGFVDLEDAELSVVVAIAAVDDGHYEAQLELRLRASGEVLGTRGLRSDARDCASLDEPLAVIVAMLLNVPREELALPPARSPWEARITARGGFGIGALPGPSVEAELEVGATLRDVMSLGVAVGYGWSDTVRAAEGQLFVQGGALRLVVAPIVTSGEAVELSIPLAAGLGIAYAEASGFAASRGQTVLFFDVSAGLRLGILLTPGLALELGGDLRAIPLPPTFSVRNGDGTLEPLFQALPVAGSFHGGLSLHLP